MKGVKLALVDYSLPRKIKGVQNLSFIIAAFGLFISIVLHPFNVLSELVLAYLMMITIAATTICILLGVIFLLAKSIISRNEKGTAIIVEDNIQLTLDNEQLNYKLKDITIHLNIEDLPLPDHPVLTSDVIEKLSDWNNFIKVESEGNPAKVNFEFEPNIDLLKIADKTTIAVNPSPFLLNKTTNLLKNLAMAIAGM